jgi:hypothetical protein
MAKRLNNQPRFSCTAQKESLKEYDMKAFSNDRGRHERRQGDLALAPGCFDRRHNAERRLPEMAVLRLSANDWQKYFGASIAMSEKSEQKIFQDSNVFNKGRTD